MPEVSFVLPAYKRKYLKEAIASILAQTYRDFELVVVDDCSPEGLKEIVEEFHDERLSYYCNEKNIGGKDLVAAWTHAMAYARGEWCVLASDDDVYLPEYLEEMIRLRDKYPECDLFHSRMAIIDAEGNWIGGGHGRIEHETQLQMVYSRGVLGVVQTMADFMFRRKSYEQIGGFVRFPRAWYSDDATWFSLAANGCVCSPRILYCWRSSGDNISTRFDDVLEKLAASMAYKKWAEEFISRIRPGSREENEFICKICNEICRRVDNLSRWEMQQLNLVSWLKVMMRTHVGRTLKRAFVLDRIRTPYHPRRY